MEGFHHRLNDGSNYVWFSFWFFWPDFCTDGRWLPLWRRRGLPSPGCVCPRMSCCSPESLWRAKPPAASCRNQWRTSICACLAAHLKQQTVGRFKGRLKILLETFMILCFFCIGELELAAARCESTEIIITLAWFLSDLADMTCLRCIQLSSNHDYFIHFCCLSPQYSFSKWMYILKCVTEYNLAGFTWSPEA